MPASSASPERGPLPGHRQEAAAHVPLHVAVDGRHLAAVRPAGHAPNLLCRTVTNRTLCVMDVGLDVEWKKLLTVGMIMWRVVLGFLPPFLAMTVSYCFLGCAVTQHFDAMRKVDRHKRRTLRIIITLTAVFAACWMPHHVVRCTISLIILDQVPSSIAFRPFLVLAYPYASSLVCINSCLNPFLFAFFDLRFRTQCLRRLHLKN